MPRILDRVFILPRGGLFVVTEESKLMAISLLLCRLWSYVDYELEMISYKLQRKFPGEAAEWENVGNINSRLEGAGDRTWTGLFRRLVKQAIRTPRLHQTGESCQPRGTREWKFSR